MIIHARHLQRRLNPTQIGSRVADEVVFALDVQHFAHFLIDLVLDLWPRPLLHALQSRKTPLVHPTGRGLLDVVHMELDRVKRLHFRLEQL